MKYIRERIESSIREYAGNSIGILYCGSFSRGESTYIDGKLIGDIEFKIIVPFKFSRALISQIGARLSALSEELSVELDFDFVHSWKLFFAPRTLFWVETFRSDDYSGPDSLFRLAQRVQRDRDPDPGDIYDIFNHSSLSIIKEIGRDDVFLKYKYLKGISDLIIVYLFNKGDFCVGHRARLSRVKSDAYFSDQWISRSPELFELLFKCKMEGFNVSSGELCEISLGVLSSLYLDLFLSLLKSSVQLGLSRRRPRSFLRSIYVLKNGSTRRCYTVTELIILNYSVLAQGHNRVSGEMINDVLRVNAHQYRYVK